MLQVNDDSFDAAAVHKKRDAIEAIWIADGYVVMLFKFLRGVARPKDGLIVFKSIYCHEF